MPTVNGQNFPEYTHQEYPKVLYRDGDIASKLTITVANITEEQEAAERGFAPAPTADPGDEVAVPLTEADEAAVAALEAEEAAQDPAPAPRKRR
jgi:hypothetical protein